MKFGRLLLAVVGATVLLGALVSSASARNFSISSQTKTMLWTRLDFIGGFDTVECEVKLSGSLHARTLVKSVGTLIGYITEGTVLACRRGSATLNQASLPWHRRYGGFTGTLPRIAAQTQTVSGLEWTLREPVFGITCTIRREAGTITITLTISSGVLTTASISGTCRCDPYSASISGSTTNVAVSGARLTVTLI